MSQISTPEADRAIIFDTETHDKHSPRIIESAYGYVDKVSARLDASSIVVQRFNPGAPIAYGAMATHHIVDEDLVGCPSHETFALPADVRYVIGHNVGFDMKAAGNPEGFLMIDTLALSRKVWPDIDSHTQTALFYMLHSTLGLDMNRAREFVKDAHSAATDIQMCGFIFEQLAIELDDLIPRAEDVAGRSLDLMEAMHMISQAAGIPLVIEFGKHAGTPAHRVPADYKRWYRGVENPDPGLLLAMDEGGPTEDGRALYALAKELFGPEPQPCTSTPVQRGFSFK